MPDDKDFDPWAAPKKLSTPKKKKLPGEAGPAPDKPLKKAKAVQPKKNPEQEFDEVFKKFRRNTELFLKKKNGDKGKGLSFLSGILFFLVLGSSLIYLTGGEKAIVLRNGSYNRTVGSGLSFKLPSPFETAYKKDVSADYQTEVSSGNDSNLLPTANGQLVDVEFSVNWKITKLQNYFFKIADPEKMLENTANIAMRQAVAKAEFTDYTANSFDIKKTAESAAQSLQAMLDIYDSGIQITNIEIHKFSPPNVLKDELAEWEKVRKESAELKAAALSEKTELLLKSNTESIKEIENAREYKQAVIAKAQAETARFNAAYEQYVRAKDITRTRIYLDTMQDVLGNMNKVIIDDNGKLSGKINLDNLKILPGQGDVKK